MTRSGFKKAFLKPLLVAAGMTRTKAEALAKAFGATRGVGTTGPRSSLELFKMGRSPFLNPVLVSKERQKVSVLIKGNHLLSD